MVAGAYQGAAFDKFEAHCHSPFLIMSEQVWVDEFLHRQVQLCWLQILTDREDVAAMVHEVVHDGIHFVNSFAETHHHT